MLTTAMEDPFRTLAAWKAGNLGYRSGCHVATVVPTARGCVAARGASASNPAALLGPGSVASVPMTCVQLLATQDLVGIVVS